jgi:DNA-binding FadR family transcriptional regulator
VLVAHFGVARSTFREAFRILEAEGLISVSRGARAGATVHRPSVRIASRYVSLIMQANKVTLDDVYLCLGLIEPAVIRLLAEKGSRSGFAALRKEIDAAYRTLDDDHEYGLHSARFHQLLVEQAGIKSLSILMDMISDLIGSYVESSAGARARADSLVDSRSSKLKLMKAREKLVELLEKRDAAAAELIWKKYLESTREFMRKLLPARSVQDALESG